MEELLLRGLLAGDELDIVYQQKVCHAVLHAEVLGAAGADGGDQLIGELLAGNVHDNEIGWVRLISVWMAVSRWVLPRPEPP